MANKISVLIDVATDKAVAGLKGFKSSIGDADGAVNKFKAGAGAAFDQVKAHAGALAIGAGAALVTFGVKAVTAFQDSALGAGKFADATGLSTEAASRWVAVADDIGISAVSMEKSFGKLAVSVGKNNPLLEEYGITVRKGADGQDDMNATMLHAIDVIRNIQDPTKKAAVAQAALGKGWMEMAELIDQGSSTLTKSMAEVSEAQIIDEDEVAKARKMRESMDQLQDAVRDVALVIGEDLVPMVSVMADGLVKVIGPLSDMNQRAKDLATSVLTLTGVMEGNNSAIENAPVLLGKMGESLDAATRAGDMQTEMQEGMRGAIGETSEATDDLSRANEILASRIETTTDRYRDLKGELSAEEAFHNAEKMWDELGQSATDAWVAAEDGADDASQKMFDHKGKVIDAKQAVVELGEKYAELPEEEITRIVALIDEGQLEEAERRFNILTRNREMQVSIVARGGSGNFQVTPGLNFDSGGMVPGPVGKPQLAVVHGGEEVLTPAQQKADGAMSLTINHYGGEITYSKLSHALTMLRLSR